jgi:hypothetical protein
MVSLLPYFIIKTDKDLNPIRDKNGFCINCDPGRNKLKISLETKIIS